MTVTSTWLRTIYGAAALGICWAAPATAEEDPERRGTAWGVGFGYPMFIALVADASLSQHVRLQGTLSPLIYANSMTGRVLVGGPVGVVDVAGFLGLGAMDEQSHRSEITGSTRFVWLGVNVTLPLGFVELFADAGLMAGMVTSNGYEPTSGSGSVGLLLGR